MIPDVGSDLKVDLRCGFAHLKDKMVGPKGLIVKMEKLVKDAPTDALVGSNCDDGEQILKIMEAFRVRLMEKIDGVDGCRKGDIGALQKALTEMNNEYVKSVEESSTEVATALEFAQNEQKKTNKLTGMKNRYKVTKFKEMLAVGGFGPKFGGRIAQALFTDESQDYIPDANLVRDEFDYNKVQVWLANDVSDLGKKVHKLTEQVQEASQTTVASKIESTNASMSNIQNDGWGGCVCVVDTVLSASFNVSVKFAPFGNPLYMEETGGDCWISCCKVNKFRYGPASMPIPGVSCMIQAKVTRMQFCVFSVHKLITQGITLSDFPQFLETPGGEQFQKVNSCFFSLDVGDTAFIPFGHVVVPLYACKDSGATWSQAWCMPLFVEAYTVSQPHITIEVKRAIAEHNRAHFLEKRGRRIWDARAAVFEKFMKLLGLPAPVPVE